MRKNDGVLRQAARTVGAAVGKIASAVGVSVPETKHKKPRLPRKQKKSLKKQSRAK